MIKPDSLRAHLAAALPQLRRDPDRLLVFIEGGSLSSTFAAGLSFEYRYTLKLVLTDYAGHPDTVMVPLLVWLHVHQPELLANPSLRDQIAFEAEILNADTVDLVVRLPLTERVGVKPRAGGGHDIEHYPEPQLETPLQAGRWEVYLRGDLVTTFDSPPA